MPLLPQALVIMTRDVGEMLGRVSKLHLKACIFRTFRNIFRFKFDSRNRSGRLNRREQAHFLSDASRGAQVPEARR